MKIRVCHEFDHSKTLWVDCHLVPLTIHEYLQVFKNDVLYYADNHTLYYSAYNILDLISDVDNSNYKILKNIVDRNTTQYANRPPNWVLIDILKNTICDILIPRKVAISIISNFCDSENQSMCKLIIEKIKDEVFDSEGVITEYDQDIEKLHDVNKFSPRIFHIGKPEEDSKGYGINNLIDPTTENIVPIDEYIKDGEGIHMDKIGVGDTEYLKDLDKTIAKKDGEYLHHLYHTLYWQYDIRNITEIEMYDKLVEWGYLERCNFGHKVSGYRPSFKAYKDEYMITIECINFKLDAINTLIKITPKGVKHIVELFDKYQQKKDIDN